VRITGGASLVRARRRDRTADLGRPASPRARGGGRREVLVDNAARRMVASAEDTAADELRAPAG